MTLLDRYILRTLVMNYIIALLVMISLYLVLDLFFNIDEFTEQGTGSAEMLRNVGTYYGAFIFLYFSQISGVVTLLACAITLARMRKLNELTAMASSCISLHRVTVLVLAFGLVTTGLWLLDTEFVIPSIAHQLARRRDDPTGQKSYGVWFVPDRGGAALLCAQEFVPREQKLRRVLILHRDNSDVFDEFIEADEAIWVPVPGREAGGYWRLERGLRRSRVKSADKIGPNEDVQTLVAPGYQSDLDPDSIQLRLSAQWIKYLSFRQLSQLVSHSPADAAEIQQIKQARFTTPITSLILLMLGIPFFLNRAPGSVLSDGAKCLVVCGACFLVAFACQHMMRAGLSGWMGWLAAWLPVVLFAPPAVVLIDRVKT
ncbi:MAG TPA: LptF/LptG family permease [Phycisphaerae bacterium]|jgi:lipopolysaccharide export system permease protein